MKSSFLLFTGLLITLGSLSQVTKRVLFLGNSYTATNNLPQLIANIAASSGDTFYFAISAPGGHTLQNHTSNTNSLLKIRQGGWDVVVLQEQSQLPSLPDSQVLRFSFPYARFLDSMINKHNPCCETMFFQTWGRKSGDVSNCAWWPPVCTYEGMDSLLYKRYMEMTYNNDAVVSPVGYAWKYIRQYYPSIQLYQSDQSHPSPAGSYAAAVCFYTALFRKNPTQLNYNYSLPLADAANIRTAVKNMVYDSLIKWQIGKFDATAAFNYVISANNRISFNNLSQHAGDYFWNFGDGEYALDASPVHQYAVVGNYQVQLIVNGCRTADTASQLIVVPGLDTVRQIKPSFYPNPVTNEVYLELYNLKMEKVSISNVVGQKYSPSYHVVGNRLTIDLTSFETGVYFITCMLDGKIITQKIIKK